MALLVNEAVTAAILDYSAPDIAVAYMRQSGILPGGRQGGPLDRELQYWLDEVVPLFFDGELRMTTEIRYVGADSSRAVISGSADTGPGTSAGAHQSSAGSGSVTVPTLMRSLPPLFLVFFSCLVGLWFKADLSTGFYRRLAPYVSPGALYLPYFSAAAVLAGGASFLFVAIASLTYSDFYAGLLAEAILLILYVAYLAAFSYFLTGLLPWQGALAAAMPFLLAACLLFCPIFVDLGAYVPAINIVSVALPPTLYLRAAAATMQAAGGSGLSQLATALGGHLGYLIAWATFLALGYVTRKLHRA